MNEDVKPENLRIHSRADELIACLEGEIAKRDEELAACRVAVENCEVFRARIGELEELLLRVQVSLSLDDTEWGYSGAEKYKLLADIRAALSSGKDSAP